MSAPVIYEVNIEIDPRIDAAYRAWLRTHVDELLALEGFVEAHVYDVLDPATDDGWAGLCVQYALTGADALDAYLREHAPRLRAEGIARFGDGMRARRRVLRLV